MSTPCCQMEMYGGSGNLVLRKKKGRKAKKAKKPDGAAAARGRGGCRGRCGGRRGCRRGVEGGEGDGAAGGEGGEEGGADGPDAGCRVEFDFEESALCRQAPDRQVRQAAASFDELEPEARA